MPALLKDIMGWDDRLIARAGIPQYPCLIDQKHIVGELYDIINVPMAVWIDEKGRIVRPAESAGVNDGVRSLDPKTFAMPADVVAEGKRLRTSYVDAIRDWVEKGERKSHSLPRCANCSMRSTQLPSTAALSFPSSTINQPRDSTMKKTDQRHNI